MRSDLTCAPLDRSFIGVLWAWAYSSCRWFSTDWISEMSLAMSPQFVTSLTALFSASALPLPLLSKVATVFAWALAAGSGVAVAGLAEVDVDGSDAVELVLGEGDVAADDLGAVGEDADVRPTSLACAAW